jgi:hypothetical protein
LVSLDLHSLWGKLCLSKLCTALNSLWILLFCCVGFHFPSLPYGSWWLLQPQSSCL